MHSAEVNFENTYWGRQTKKAISLIILCSFYLKVKVTIYNLAASGQPPIHKLAIIFPCKNCFFSQPLNFSTYSLARFWSRGNCILARTGINGPDSVLPLHTTQEPLYAQPRPGCGGAAHSGFTALSGISWVHNVNCTNKL